MTSRTLFRLPNVEEARTSDPTLTHMIRTAGSPLECPGPSRARRLPQCFDWACTLEGSRDTEAPSYSSKLALEARRLETPPWAVLPLPVTYSRCKVRAVQLTEKPTGRPIHDLVPNGGGQKQKPATWRRRASRMNTFPAGVLFLFFFSSRVRTDGLESLGR